MVLVRDAGGRSPCRHTCAGINCTHELIALSSAHPYSPPCPASPCLSPSHSSCSATLGCRHRLRVFQVAVASVLCRHVEVMEETGVMNTLQAQWLFALAAVLEKPVHAGVVSTLRALLRKVRGVLHRLLHKRAMHGCLVVAGFAFAVTMLPHGQPHEQPVQAVSVPAGIDTDNDCGDVFTHVPCFDVHYMILHATCFGVFHRAVSSMQLLAPPMVVCPECVCVQNWHSPLGGSLARGPVSSHRPPAALPQHAGCGGRCLFWAG